MAGDPSDVRRTPIYLSFLILKSCAEGVVRIHHVAAASVHHSLRFSGRARGIQNEEHVFCIHFLCLTGGGYLAYFGIPQNITVGLELNAGANMFFNNYSSYVRAMLQRVVDNTFKVDSFFTAESAIRREHYLTTCISNPVRKRFG